GSRRIGSIQALNAELSAWHTQRNEKQKGVDWQFTAADARVKLKRLYPEIIE
ncbi:MAG: IS630 family transposase, partial [Treponema sp.]|nr:IS630 family transposase [Treponema sp.]